MYKAYPCPYFSKASMSNSNNLYKSCKMYPCPYFQNASICKSNYHTDYHPECTTQLSNQYLPPTNDVNCDDYIELKDYGPEPFVINIEEATTQNNTFRTALWTGKHLQLTLMSINVGEDIGLEIHPCLDQFIRIEKGQGLVLMGDRQDNLCFQENVYDDYIFIIPAGKWHNLINTGNTPIKLYSIYAPPQHPWGTVHETKADAEADE